MTYAGEIVMSLALRMYYVRENARRDKLCGEEQPNGDDLNFTDRTDMELWRTFRYAM